MFREKVSSMIYRGEDLKLVRGQKVWINRFQIEQVTYLGHGLMGHSYTKIPFEEGDHVCHHPDHYAQQFVAATTREELLLHAIDQQKAKIADAQAEIERLQGLREVRDEPEPEVHFWVGFFEPVKRAFYKSSIRSKLLWCGDRTSASKMIGYHDKNISIHYVEGWEELNDVDFIRAQVVNLRMANVVTEFIVQR